MKKLFINTNEDDDIKEITEKAVDIAKAFYPDEEIVPFIPAEQNIQESKNSLFYCGIILSELSSSDLVYFSKGWRTDSIGQLEHHGAFEYGVEIIND